MGLFSGWGPFLTKEEKAQINADHQRNHGGGGRPIMNLPRSVNTNLGSYDSSVTLPGMYSSSNAGSGGQGIDSEAPAYIAPQPRIEPPAPAPTPDPPRTRDVDAPDGTEAKGTQMSPKIDMAAANGLLSRIGAGQLADVNSFLSEQLPASPSEKSVAPGESLVMDDDAFSLAIQRPENDQFRAGFDWSEDSSVGALRAYAKGKGFDDELVVEGASVAGQPDQPATTPVGSADNTRAVSVPGEEVVADPQNSGTNWGVAQPKSYDRARRDAFLNGDMGSMAALRAANAATGRFTQGGKRFYNVGGELQEVNEETWRAGGQKQLSAEELKAGYVTGIKSTLVPADTTDVTSPDEPEVTYEGNESDDYTTMGYSTEDAEQLQGGGGIQTDITPDGMKSSYFNKGQEIEFEHNNTNPGT